MGRQLYLVPPCEVRTVKEEVREKLQDFALRQAVRDERRRRRGKGKRRRPAESEAVQRQLDFPE